MPIDSVATLVSQLEQNGLLAPEPRPELADLVQTGPQDPRAFAEVLRERGWLTDYQVDQVFQDNAAGLVLGSYVLLDRLGSGGMGQVFKARHQKLGRIVALKVINPAHLHKPVAVHRFHREIRAAAQLDHPNIVHAYDAEEASGSHFLVMEYIEGTDLGRLVKQHGPIPVAQASEYIRQAALGLQHAHERGLVHRDVKPNNLLLSLRPGVGRPEPEPVIKLLDLGLALLQRPLLDSDSGPVSVAGTVVGTVDFLAPEQARDSNTVDIRADLYSLGCTFYYLLTGKVPFTGATATNKIFKHALEEPVPVEQLCPELPLHVAAIVRRLMAKRPEDRFQTPGELAAVLANVVHGRPATAAVVAVVASSRRDRPSPSPMPSVPRTPFPRLLRSRRSPSHRQPWQLPSWPWLLFNVVGLLLLFFLLGLFIFLVSRR
jgi:serine/threonine protein kinase